MKTTILSALLLSTLLFASCSKEEAPEVNDRIVKFSSGITATPQTKVVTDNAGESKWQANDQIGISMVANGTMTIAENADNIPYKATSAATSTSFVPAGATTIYYPVNAPEKVDFIAYYPYDASVANWTVPVDVSAQTSQADIDLMYATANNSGAGFDKTSTGVNFTFQHQLVKLMLNVIKGDGVDGDITSVTINGMNTSAKFDLKGADGVTDLATPQAIVPHEVTASTAYEAILLPAATLDAANTVVFTTSKDEAFTWLMTDNANTLEAGKIYTYNITLTKHAITVTGSIDSWTVGSISDGTAK